MADMVQVVCRAALARAAPWLSVGVLVLLMLSRAASVSTRQSGSSGSGSSGYSSADGLPLVWQQLLDPTVQLRGQSCEDVFQVGPRLMSAELSRLCRRPNYAEWARFCQDPPLLACDRFGIV